MIGYNYKTKHCCFWQLTVNLTSNQLICSIVFVNASLPRASSSMVCSTLICVRMETSTSASSMPTLACASLWRTPLPSRRRGATWAWLPCKPIPQCTCSFSSKPRHLMASSSSTVEMATTLLLWSWSKGECDADANENISLKSWIPEIIILKLLC